ncbi:MAG: hypothetical protein GX616_16775, partial [Planctomycetes bacterium]|nr:hypothetical protein [Planctomycetota bacterium]
MKGRLLVVVLLCHVSSVSAEDKDNPGKTIAPVTDQDRAMLVPPKELAGNPAFTVAK